QTVNERAESSHPAGYLLDGHLCEPAALRYRPDPGSQRAPRQSSGLGQRRPAGGTEVALQPGPTPGDQLVYPDWLLAHLAIKPVPAIADGSSGALT
ncbi:MAG TPA: hypothetical protein VEJ84_05305, partial [Acidimicrobiales bacterium]|nr:hypothetical protein [Acidimicrobiales bacterium]